MSLCAASLSTGLALADGPEPDIFYDDDGLIVHKGMDGGDTAQREGWYWLGVWVRQHVLNDPWTVPRRLTFEQVLRLLEPNQDGIFCRHPKLAPWNNPHDGKFGFSRDQMTPLVAAMGVWGQLDPLRRLWNALPQDPVGGTKHAYNGQWVEAFGKKIAFTGDVVGPSMINLFRRAWNEDPAVASDGNGPSGDREMLLNSALMVPPALNDRDESGNDLNHIVTLLMAQLRYPSATADKALSVYAKNRLVSYGSFVASYNKTYGADVLASVFTPKDRERMDAGIKDGWSTDTGRVFGAVRWYHRSSTGANPMLATLFEPIVQRYFT